MKEKTELGMWNREKHSRTLRETKPPDLQGCHELSHKETRAINSFKNMFPPGAEGNGKTEFFQQKGCESGRLRTKTGLVSSCNEAHLK